MYEKAPRPFDHDSVSRWRDRPFANLALIVFLAWLSGIVMTKLIHFIKRTENIS